MAAQKNSVWIKALNGDDLQPNWYMSDREIVQTKKYRFEAHCLSDICHMQVNFRNPKIGTIKNVAKFKSFCPDCGHALVWNKFEIKGEK